MRPETVHLIATVFRHGRGILNALEKFERTVPREHRAREVASAIEFGRQMMTAAERTFAVASTEKVGAADRA